MEKKIFELREDVGNVNGGESLDTRTAAVWEDGELVGSFEEFDGDGGSKVG